MPSQSALSPLHPSIPAVDGVVLRGELNYPRGRPGTRFPLAVLAHQYLATRDCFAPLCADLHRFGVATLAFDLRGHGESIQTPSGLLVAPTPAEPKMEAFGEAFMASAKAVRFQHIADDIVRVAAWGLAQNFIDSSRLLLIGGSVGGTGVLLAAPRLAPLLSGVLTFGAAGAGVHSADAMERIRENCETLSVPALLATSADDPFDGANNVRVWSKGLRRVEAKIVPGADHAMAIYHQVRRDVRVFVKAIVDGSRRRATPRRQR